ncbi:MAG: TIM-barrel domain-containing protein, partial [Janthinobacterium lividum]
MNTATRYVLLFASVGSLSLNAQQLTLTRDNATVVVEPYAPNIVHVTLSLNRADALAPAGYGISGGPVSTGWTASSQSTGDTLTSSRLVVSVAPQGPKYTPTGTGADIAKFFGGSTPYVGLSIKTPQGDTLVNMQGWQMSVPNHKDGNADVLYDRRPTDHAFYQVGASFASPRDEHYYGLGQNQEGFLDRRGHVLRCAHDYNAPSGQSVCVPFVVTNKGYGIVWDNPSATTVAFGFNDQTRWTSDVGQRVSFFVIAGGSYDEIYQGYRTLTGTTPMLPKSAYGYIQCKQRYTSQAELMAVAKGYRDRHYPIDDLVIDWFHYTKMGEMDMDPKQWPDPVAMNKQLHAMNFHTMISVWPRFVPEDRYYSTVLK